MLELNAAMEFDCPVTVRDNGMVVAGTTEAYAPDVVWFHSDGSDADDYMESALREQGWEALSGYTGQYMYNGPIMHASEYLGGRLARDILTDPGVYVTLVVSDQDDDTDDNVVGWIVAKQLTT